MMSMSHLVSNRPPINLVNSSIAPRQPNPIQSHNHNNSSSNNNNNNNNSTLNINNTQSRLSYTPKIKFTKEEDRQLFSLVAKYGDNDWNNIASLMKTRNVRQCRERWNNYINPKKTNAPWSEEEDALLDAKYRELGPKWQALAEFFPDRSVNNIKNRFNTKQRREMKKLRKEGGNNALTMINTYSMAPKTTPTSLVTPVAQLGQTTAAVVTALNQEPHPKLISKSTFQANKSIAQNDDNSQPILPDAERSVFEISGGRSTSHIKIPEFFEYPKYEKIEDESSSNDECSSEPQDKDPFSFLDCLQETEVMFWSNGLNDNSSSWINVSYPYL